MTLNQESQVHILFAWTFVWILNVFKSTTRFSSFKCNCITDICSALKLAAREFAWLRSCSIAKSKTYTLFILIFICLLLFSCIIDGSENMAGGVLYFMLFVCLSSGWYIFLYSTWSQTTGKMAAKEASREISWFCARHCVFVIAGVKGRMWLVRGGAWRIIAQKAPPLCGAQMSFMRKLSLSIIVRPRRVKHPKRITEMSEKKKCSDQITHRKTSEVSHISMFWLSTS